MLACLLACALWFALTLPLRPLAIPDEGRYVGVAWEMLRSGRWLVPTLDGMPFFHKPPLFYWITATSMSMFGPGAGAARLAPWLAAVGMCTALFAFIREWVGPQAAVRSVLILATMPLFYGGSQYANLDMLVATFIGLSLLAAAHATLASERGRPVRRMLVFAFASAAFGVLSKGLIGVVLPTLVLLAWGLTTRRLARVLRLLAWWPGWLIFLLIATPWFIAMQSTFPDFLHYFFVVQQFDRFQASGFNNPQPVWFYGAVLLLLTLPWSPWLLVLARPRPRESNPQAHSSSGRDVRILMLAWLVVITAFFSMPDSKLIGYILPVLAPWASLIATAFRGGRDRRWLVTGALAGLFCMSAAVWMHYGQPKSQASLAAALRAGYRPGDTVVFFGQYYYDLAFYAGLTDPVDVLDDWSPEELAKDSWRRELVDAEAFASPATARIRLDRKNFAAVVCRARGVWFVGPLPDEGAPPPPRPWLAGAKEVFRSESDALWHLNPRSPESRDALGCDKPAP